MQFRIILISSFAVLVNAQYFKQFKEFTGDNQVNDIYNGVSSIFVTGTIDDHSMLKRIIFKSQNETKNAYQLTQNKYLRDSDSMFRWSISGKTTMTTDLTTAQLSQLTGGVFCTSEKQATDKNLHVHDITQNQPIYIDNGDSTWVFLNSGYQKPPETAKFTITSFLNWKQPAGFSIAMYTGVPTDAAENADKQIFANPVLVKNKNVLFDSVEDFTVTTNVFYMKVSGQGTDMMSFSTSPVYKDVNNLKTKSTTSTGFFMKSVNELPRTVTIYPTRDSSSQGTTGTNSIAFFPQANGELVLQSDSGSRATIHSIFSSSQVTRWTLPSIGDDLIMTPKRIDDGTFFVQYYFIKGDPVTPSTNSPAASPASSPSTLLPGRQTTAYGPIKVGTTQPSHLQTTTQSARSLNVLLTSLFISAAVFL